MAQSVTVRGRQDKHLLIRVTIAFIAGILIAWRLDFSTTALVLFLIGAALSAALLRTRGRTMLPALLVAALLLTALRFELSEGRSPGLLPDYHSVQGVMIEGSIAADPQSSSAQSRLRLHVDSIFSDGFTRQDTEWRLRWPGQCRNLSRLWVSRFC